MYQNLAVVAAFLLAYSIFAGRFESRLVNGPLMFMLAGLLLGPAALGVLGVLAPHIGKEGIKLLAEMTLAIVLFSDAANANLRVLRIHEALPPRLLLIGLPLTLLATAICTVLLSVLLHGLSANPLAAKFNRTKKMGAG